MDYDYYPGHDYACYAGEDGVAPEEVGASEIPELIGELVEAAPEVEGSIALTLWRGGPLELAAQLPVPSWAAQFFLVLVVLLFSSWFLLQLSGLKKCLKRVRERLCGPTYAPHVLTAYSRFAVGLQNAAVLRARDGVLERFWSEWSQLTHRIRQNLVATTWAECNQWQARLRGHPWNRVYRARIEAGLVPGKRPKPKRTQ